MLAQISKLDIIRICVSFLLEAILQAQEEIDETETQTETAATANERKNKPISSSWTHAQKLGWELRKHF
jgi:hypothetical protein